jgi:hypothetical protein
MNTKQDSPRTGAAPEQIMDALGKGLPGVDAGRARELGQAGLLRNAKARSLAREQRLLARYHGDTHPRIGIARGKLAANEPLRRDLAVAREAVEAPVVTPTREEFVVHGFVRRRETGAGIPGLTLALADARGRWLREAGYACTDARGYFRLAIPLGSSYTPQAAGVAMDKASDMASAGKPTRVAVQLRVHSPAGAVLHTEKDPVEPRPGGTDYRLIHLGKLEDLCGCNPPPSEPGTRPLPEGPIVERPGESQGRPRVESSAASGPADPSEKRAGEVRPSGGKRGRKG